MKPPLEGGTILVTGASSGIGREMARQLAGRAGTLILAARRADRLEALASELRREHRGLRILVQPCDVAEPASVDRMLQSVAREAGPVDILINNAGIGGIGLFECAPWEKLEAMIRVNVTGLTYLTHRLLPEMIRRGRGGILNVSSGFGLTVMPGVAGYAASKHYATALTEALRMELTGTGITVSQLCPGPVDTEFESVAGNPTGRPVPALLQLRPERVARVGLRGFEKGKAIILPGFWIGILMALGRVTPRPVLRCVYSGIGSFLRRRQTAASATS
jgi:short-subunit dehydrogenase